MFVIADAALTTTLGLLAFLIGMGVVANALIVFIVVRVLGERSENEVDQRGTSLRTQRR